jgi:hypothetical protein
MHCERPHPADNGPPEENEAVRHLKEQVAAGQPWHTALLEAIALWTWPEESYDGQRYVFLIDGEAFDWLLLAERLCAEIAEAIPEEELRDLLFRGRLPREMGEDELREAIGDAKYHAHLNYLYGVTVERFVLLAVEEEILKERQSHVFSGSGSADAYERLYDVSQEALLDRFRTEKGYQGGDSVSVRELREFTYWLFKYRLERHDKERVASDTAKGVALLNEQRANGSFSIPRRGAADIIEHGVP